MAATTTMTYASKLDNATVDKRAPFEGTGIEEQEMGGLKEMLAAVAAGGDADGGIGIGGFNERSRRATMPTTMDAFKPKTHEVVQLVHLHVLSPRLLPLNSPDV
jgi:hypothetical protein